MLTLLRTPITILAAVALFGCSQEPAPSATPTPTPKPSNVTPANTYSISGTVSDTNNNPLKNVKVVLSDASGAAITNTLSNNVGYYSFTGLANGSYTVAADLTTLNLVADTQIVNIRGASMTVNCAGRPRPPATPTPVPTATPTPTATPVPTSTPTPTPAPTGTPIPTATPTPKPSATPTPVPTATPTVTPVPTSTPTPTPTATPTPLPTATPTPVPTPLPPGTSRAELHITAGTLNINGKAGTAIAAIPVWRFYDIADTSTSKPSIPGPAITVTEGDTVNITIYNDHTVKHNFVIQGITTDTTEITPGTSRLYTFVANTPGTYLYYDSLNEVNREMGLYGALIVNPKDGSKTAWAGAPSYDFQRTWVLGDMDVARWNTTADANARLSVPVNPPPVTTAIYKPNYFVINGKSGFDAMETLTGSDTTIDGLVGQRALVRIVNGGLFAQALHFHANHVQMLSKNGVHATVPYKLLDVVNVPPLSTVEVLFELNQLGKYPMHNHTAQMETANGTYLGGVATMIIIK